MVHLHVNPEPGSVVKKVWRFDTTSIKHYSRVAVQAELVQLFPDVSRRGLKFDMWYEDDLAGEVRTSRLYLLCSINTYIL